jgi:hypothetical protein
MRSVHDMGGLPAGPVDPSDHERESWEKRTDAIAAVLRWRPEPIRLDEMRRHGEQLGDGYLAYAYGERTLHALTQALVAHGLVSVDELGRAMAQAAEREA